MVSLSQLILLLSSDQPGEIAAAARAIGKRLAREGHDWHWFAEQVDRVISNGNSGNGYGRTDHKAAGNEIDHQAAAAWLLDNCDPVLSPKERDFLETMTRWVGEPTEKQAAWLSALMRKYRYRP